MNTTSIPHKLQTNHANIQQTTTRSATTVNLLFKRILVSACFAAMCLFLSGCGSSDSDKKSKTIRLPKGVTIEMVLTPVGWFGKYEVTQAQWEAVMGTNPSEFAGANNPVENVSWNYVQAFLLKLNSLSSVKRSGLVFRLPTCTEWRCACLAGATGDYCLLADGTEISEDTIDRVAWHKGNSNNKTHPVGQKEPNAFGLYDMNGNVQEWTQDKYEVINPGSRVGHNPVTFGGGFTLGGVICTAYSPGYSSPDYTSNDQGFRLIADVMTNADQ